MASNYVKLRLGTVTPLESVLTQPKVAVFCNCQHSERSK